MTTALILFCSGQGNKPCLFLSRHTQGFIPIKIFSETCKMLFSLNLVTACMLRACLYLFISLLVTSESFSQCYVRAQGINTLCYNSCDGSALADSVAGQSPYTYVWSPGNISGQNITALCPGSYTVTMTDNGGCSATATTNIFQPSQITAFTSSNPTSRCDTCDGAAFAIAGGGTPPYTYLWTTTQTGSNISGLCTGFYGVTITDANGCTKTGSVTVSSPPLPSLSISTNPASCGTCPDGTAIATVSGGNSPYLYLWSDGQTTATATALLPGSYSFCVTDADSCKRCDTIFISFATGIVYDPEFSFSAGPNPFSASVAFHISSTLPALCSFELTDLSGRKLRSFLITGPSFILPRSGLLPGIYHYRILSGDNLLASGRLIAQ